MKTRANLAWLSAFVFIYMLAALCWWAILLNEKNREAYLLQKELVIKEIKTDSIQNRAKVEDLLTNLAVNYHKNRRMILGESLVFGIALVIGIWLIYRSFRKEISISKRQSNFLLSITHEFKSPISTIKLVLDTLSGRKIDSVKTAELSKIAMEETERLEILVNNLLFSAKMESGYSYNYEEVEMHSIISQLKTYFLRIYPDSELILHCPETLKLRCDRETIHILLKNLIENAIKYSNDTKQVTVECTDTMRDLIILIKDFGIGIPDSEKKFIFDKFYRIGSEETRSTKGTGLGLYLVKLITEAHHGKIEVLDNHPKGTIMKLAIPKNI